MAFITGSGANMAAVVSALINACTTNGWSLSGEVVHKGSTYVRIREVSGQLEIRGGTGIDGSNNLTGQGPGVMRVYNMTAPAQLSYPMNYYIHVDEDPDEVYCIVNYSTNYYQFVAFGRSDIDMPGTGNWYAASVGPNVQYLGTLSINSTNGGGSATGSGQSAGAFAWCSGSNSLGGNYNFSIHHDLDGNGWSPLGVAHNTALGGGMAIGIVGIIKAVDISPNNWNGESVLLPIPVTVGRGSGLYSLVLQPKNARYLRIDNLEPQQVIAIGTDQWRVYPFFRKDSVNRAGGPNILHSGTYGWAIRYTP